MFGFGDLDFPVIVVCFSFLVFFLSKFPRVGASIFLLMIFGWSLVVGIVAHGIFGIEGMDLMTITPFILSMLGLGLVLCLSRIESWKFGSEESEY